LVWSVGRWRRLGSVGASYRPDVREIRNLGDLDPRPVDSLGRRGLIWLPQHGYGFQQTPLWAGIYMPPMTVGFLLAAPASGVLSGRIGSRMLASSGPRHHRLDVRPADRDPGGLQLLGVRGDPATERDRHGHVLFAEPGRGDEQPARRRAGFRVLDDDDLPELGDGALDRVLVIAGLSSSLPGTMSKGLVEHGVSAASAGQIARLPAVAVLIVPSSATALFGNYSAVS
jgi:hypothetical protein